MQCAFECRSAWLFVDRAFSKCFGRLCRASIGSIELDVEVPNGLDADSAAMTEPMAVALHAVRRSRVKTSEPAIVIGGPWVRCHINA